MMSDEALRQMVRDDLAERAQPNDDLPGDISALAVGSILGCCVIAVLVVLKYADVIEAWLS